jgi:peptidoglycan hydrolase-like protein with peptidoglycan-binding domain
MAGEPDLAIGDSNEWVGYLQQLLEHNGFPVAADGYFGEATRQQLEQFQQARGLPASGAADAQTWAHLTGEADPQPY